MGFDKQTAKEAGKKSKRGADNQLKELREIYNNILEGNIDNIQEWFDRIAKDNPAKALELMLKMGSYIIPKPRAVELGGVEKGDSVKNQLDYSNLSDEELIDLMELLEKAEPGSNYLPPVIRFV